MKDRLYLKSPILCEGKYDKIRLSAVVASEIFTSEGFGIFKSKEKRELLKRIAEKKGIIVLTDSDGAGLVIRNHIRGIIPSSKIINLYIPKIKGKEKRKTASSCEGLLGVEGMDCDMLYELLSPFSLDEEDKDKTLEKITVTDLYSDGLSGGEDSRAKRMALCERAGFPDNISTKALLEALNLLYTYEEYKAMLRD